MITIKVKADYGDSCYLVKDDEQTEYTFVGIMAGPGHIMYELRLDGEKFEVYDFEVSFVKDMVKFLGASKKEEE